MIFPILVTAIGASICVGLVKLGLWYLHSYRLLLQSNCFHGPRALPLVDFYKKTQELIQNFPSPLRFWLGPILYFAIHEPEQIKLILSNSNALDKPPFFKVIKQWLGEGLFTAKGSKWKQNRKAIQPLFSTKILQSYIQIFASNAVTMTEKIWLENRNKEFDMYYYSSRYSLENICETTMGVSINALSDDNCVYLDIIESVLDVIPRRVSKPWFHSDLIFNLTPMGQKFQKCVKHLNDFLNEVLRSAKNNLQNANGNQVSRSLVSLLLSSASGECKFTDKQIRDETVTIVTAGHETLGNLLNFTTFILANYPDIQKKVLAEVHEICGECNSGGLTVTLSDLSRMEYLDRVLKETLRFFPPSTVLTRYLLGDVNIGEYTLPAGTSVFMDMFNIHRSEKYWPKALEFNPDRFLPKHPLGPRNPDAYIPFGSGTRNCIGMKYAMMSAKIFVATVVSRYVFKTKTLREAKDLELRMHAILKTKSPIMLSVERRLPATG